MRGAAALALASLLPLTSGCIAAAIPLAAGAALVKGRHSAEAVPAAPAQAAPASAAEASAPSDVRVVQTALTELPPPVGPAPAAQASARSDVRVVQTALTELPPPVGPVARADRSAIAQFRSYALAKASAPAGTRQRPSAIIANASDLRVVRSDCGALPAAVFVDLDPGRGTFDPLASGAVETALPDALDALRNGGVKVVWFSRLGAAFAPAVREALAAGGLDSAGADELVLMGDIGERKQTLRDAVAKRLCPVAMLGDERADFDELYLYLREPDAAIALDAMIGAGWFLASPFTPAASQGTMP